MANFPRYPLASEPTRPVAPNIGALNAPYEAGQQAVQVAQQAVNLGAAYLGKLADEAQKAEQLVTAQRIDQTRAQMVDELGAKVAPLVKEGKYSELRVMLSEGRDLNQLIDKYAGQFKPGIEQETARAEFMRAGAGMFPQILESARDSAFAIDRSGLHGELAGHIGDVGAARGDAIAPAIQEAVSLGMNRYNRSIAGGSIGQDAAALDFEKFHQELSGEAYKSVIATSEDIFTRTGSFGQTKAYLLKAKSDVVPNLDGKVKNDASIAIDNAIQSYDARARQIADNASKAAITAQAKLMSGIPSRLSDAMKDPENIGETAFQQAENDLKGILAAPKSPEIANQAYAMQGEIAAARQNISAYKGAANSGGLALAGRPQLDADPKYKPVYGKVLKRNVDAAGGDTGTALFLTNQSFVNLGMMNDQGVTYYRSALAQANTPAGADTLTAGLDQMTQMAPGVFADFVKTDVGRKSYDVSRRYQALKNALDSQRGSMSEIDYQTKLTGIAQQAFASGTKSPDAENVKKRQEYVAGKDGQAMLDSVMKDSLDDEMNAAFGKIGFSFNPFKLGDYLNQKKVDFNYSDFKGDHETGVNKMVYDAIKVRARDSFASLVHSDDPEADMQAALHYAVSDVMNEYSWLPGKGFVKASPFTQAKTPQAQAQMQQDVLNQLIAGGAIEDDPAQKAAVQANQEWFGNKDTGWSMHIRSGQSLLPVFIGGKPFVYNPKIAEKAVR